MKNINLCKIPVKFIIRPKYLTNPQAKSSKKLMLSIGASVGAKGLLDSRYHTA